VAAESDSLRDVYERRAALEYPDPLPPPRRETHRKFFRVLDLVHEHLPCEALLDAGCGDGAYLEAIGASRTPPKRLAGTDISERMLETARRTAARSGVEPELVRANLEELPFGDGEFDVVLSTQVIEHLLDQAAGLRELARVLAPGGTLVITTDNARNRVTKALNSPRTMVVRALGWRGRRLKVHFPHATFMPDQFAAAVRDVGLEVLRVESFRFHLEWPLDRPLIRRVLDRLDDALPSHLVGDILTVVARK
jgi:2-polyprenyl-3-methyl-5-hydroxy-6-metoxy-1,4-benzoquinol methylase